MLYYYYITYIINICDNSKNNNIKYAISVKISQL